MTFVSRAWHSGRKVPNWKRERKIQRCDELNEEQVEAEYTKGEDKGSGSLSIVSADEFQV